MKRLLANDRVVLTARIFIGLLFIVASIEKLAEPQPFAAAIQNYRILPQGLTMIFATIIPWVELLCGLSILFGLLIRGSSLLLTSLLVIFTAAVFSALVRGLDISCGCFTQDPVVSKITWTKLAENVGLMVLTTFLFYSKSVKFSLEAFLKSRNQGERA